MTAAEKVFLKKSFLGSNMDEVAESAGVSKQTVHAHFGSKEDLFVEVVEAMTGTAAKHLKERVDDPPDDLPVEQFLLDFATEQLLIVLTPRLMRLRRLVIGEVERFPDLGHALHRNGPGRPSKDWHALSSTMPRAANWRHPTLCRRPPISIGS